MRTPVGMKGLLALAVVMAATLSSPSSAGAAGCGMAGFVGSGIVSGGTGFLAMYRTVPPFDLTATATTSLGTSAGDACMDMWVESTIGPLPANYNAVWGNNSGACSAAACVDDAICVATLCGAFPD